MAGKHVGGSVALSGISNASRIRAPHYHNHRLDKAYAEGRAGVPAADPHPTGSPASNSFVCRGRMMTNLFKDDCPPPKRACQPKKRPVFDYVRDTWFEGRDVSCERSRIGRLARNFAQLCGDLTPEDAVKEITRRRDVYRRMWPSVAETPEALFKNWSQMAQRAASIQATARQP